MVQSSEMLKRKNTEFTLNISTIKEIPFEKYSKNFTFIVNGKEYHTNRFVADFLSPKIRQFHSIDETIDTFKINTTKKYAQVDFSEILSLISFNSIILNEEKIEYFINIFSELGNFDVVQKLIPKNPTAITVENVFSKLKEKQSFFSLKKCDETVENHSKNENKDEYSNVIDELIKPEIDFISAHFFEIDKNELKKLDSILIEKVIKNEKIKLEDEDSLLKVVNELYSKDCRYSYLYEYINFLNVSQDELCHFFTIFDINDINKKIWNSIIERTLKYDIQNKEIKNMNKIKEHQKQEETKRNEFNISQQKKQEITINDSRKEIDYSQKKNQENEENTNNVNLREESKINSNNLQLKEERNQDYSQNKVIQIFHKENDDFNGIIKYLTNKIGSNIHESGEIEVTSNSFFSHPKYLLDFDTDHYFQAGKTDAWVCFDFKNKKVKLNYYSIKSNSGGKNLYHLRSWDIEASNDGENWKKIDERKNYPTLNGSYFDGTFEVKENDYSRFVRLHQTDSPWGGGCLWFYYIEFYGYLLEE